jgi:catechol-2,3-dioxygenase
MEAVAKPTKLAHFVLRTTRYDELRAWYQLVLQATVQLENPMLCFLTYDDEHHRLAIVNLPGLVPRPRASDGVDHIAFTYASLGDLLHTYARLKREGITPYWCINHGPTTSLYYRDPDGNQIELQIDNYPDVESLNAWMRSGALQANPIGVDFDPDVLLARFERGDPLSELILQGSAPVQEV